MADQLLRNVGLDGIPHDFRRTAIRNLERAGVPRSTAMQMVGHLTESVYRRYAIVVEGMLRECAEKLGMHRGRELAGKPPGIQWQVVKKRKQLTD